MLTLVQNSSNQSPKTKVQRPKSSNVRTQTLAAINATWRKLCPLDGTELRDARLAFATKALGLRKPLKSLSKCSPKQLGRVIDAMRLLEKSPTFPAEGFGLSASAFEQRPKTEDQRPEGDIVHLATGPQVTAIERLRNYLNWSAVGLQAFLIDKFNGKHSPALLTPAEANSCTMILFNIAASKAIKARRVERGQEPGRVSRRMIAMEIPALKRELGIDQKPATDFTDYTDK
jgi:hypothetical protein